MMFCRMGQFVFILRSFLDSLLKKHSPRENSVNLSIKVKRVEIDVLNLSTVLP